MTKKRNVMIISWIAVFLWMLLIFYLSAQVADDSNDLSIGFTQIILNIVEKIAPNFEFDIGTFNHIIRKNAHFFVYLVLGFLVLNALNRSGFKNIGLALLICVVYAVSDEIHQAFVPGRGPGVRDVFIDSVGSAVGIGIYLLFGKLKSLKGSS